MFPCLTPKNHKMTTKSHRSRTASIANSDSRVNCTINIHELSKKAVLREGEPPIVKEKYLVFRNTAH